jgi:hypothetical protein
MLSMQRANSNSVDIEVQVIMMKEHSKSFKRLLNGYMVLVRWHFFYAAGKPMKQLFHYHRKHSKWMPYKDIDGYVIKPHRRGRK